jgi:hypothetical protein
MNFGPPGVWRPSLKTSLAKAGDPAKNSELI